MPKTPENVSRRSFLRRTGQIGTAVAAGALFSPTVSVLNSYITPSSDRGENSPTGLVQRLQTVFGAQTANADTLSAVNNSSSLGAIVMDALPPVVGIPGNAKDYPLGTDPSGKVMGWVYTETNGSPLDKHDNTKGYYVYDGQYQKEDGTKINVNLWDQFKKDSDANGGVTVDGYPIANPYFDDQGRLCVATQKRIRQYTVDVNGNITKVEFMNIYDEIAKKGKSLDNSTDMVPDSFDWKSDPNPTLSTSWGHDAQGGKPGTIEANHINAVFGPLDEKFPQLRQYYLSHPDWFDRFGMPMAFKEYTENGAKVMTVRTQRCVLQVWGQDMPWAKAGQVVESNAGDDARKYGLIPSDASRLLTMGLGGGAPTQETPVVSFPPYESKTIQDKNVRHKFSNVNPAGLGVQTSALGEIKDYNDNGSKLVINFADNPTDFQKEDVFTVDLSQPNAKVIIHGTSIDQKGNLFYPIIYETSNPATALQALENYCTRNTVKDYVTLVLNKQAASLEETGFVLNVILPQ